MKLILVLNQSSFFLHGSINNIIHLVLAGAKPGSAKTEIHGKLNCRSLTQYHLLKLNTLYSNFQIHASEARTSC